jgi:hypothetical protein
MGLPISGIALHSFCRGLLNVNEMILWISRHRSADILRHAAGFSGNGRRVHRTGADVAARGAVSCFGSRAAAAEPSPAVA